MQCPGQDSRYWNGEDVFETKCPKCGHTVEFFKDDSQQKCRQCGHRILNPKIDFGCASYCPHAEQCLGSLPPELIGKRDDMFKDKLAIAMRKYFGTDSRRIKHAEQVAAFAEEIGKLEKAVNILAPIVEESNMQNKLPPSPKKSENSKKATWQ